MWTVQGSRSILQKTKDSVKTAYDHFMERTDLGFFQEETLGQALQECQEIANHLNKYSQLVIIGLGGSSLGARAIADALLSPDQKAKLHFLDNVDSHSLDQWLHARHDLESVGWLLCSKSGGTIEALALYDFCSQFFLERDGVEISRHSFVVSEAKASPLVDFATSRGVPQLTIPKNVGGRFSVFTPVGVAPAVFSQLSGSEIQKGVQWALRAESRVIELVCHLWQSHQSGERIFYSFQYSDRLQTFGLWLQQLWSESLGKAKTRTQAKAAPVATLVPCRGASDQHSVLQQIIEGPESKFVAFHRARDSEAGQQVLRSTQFAQSLLIDRKIGELLAAQADATRQAIEEAHPGTLVLTTEELNNTTFSGLLMLWMLTVGVMGELLDIDAFNQPGVESGKVIARRVLSQSN
jgi:glucose-6-phosphate isomerase